MNRSLYSSDAQLGQLSALIRGYLRLPFSEGLLPGRYIESAVALVKQGKVLRTYDFVDVVNEDSGVGWQVKCTQDKTPVTCKRAKIPNASTLIEESRKSVAKTQSLGRRIIEFCNEHASDSLQQYNLSQIGYCRVVVRETDVLYFEREIVSMDAPLVFDPTAFYWEWSQRKKSSGKEMLPALHGINIETGEKWFAAHVLGENQLHFSGEKNWWPVEGDDLHSLTISRPSDHEMIRYEEFLEWVTENQ